MTFVNKGKMDYILDLLSAIRYTIYDFNADPEGTALYVDDKIKQIIVILGGEKGVDRVEKNLLDWGEKCNKCDEKV